MFRIRTANTGGAADSSQMSSLFSAAPAPSRPVEEPDFVEDSVDSQVTATPFFSQNTGVVLIKGGEVVNSEETITADVLVVDGKITAVGADIEIPENAAVINASGKFVIPGGIDTNTSFRRALDGKDGVLDDFESGSRAAVAGGTTMVVDLVIPEKEESLLEAFTAWKEDGEERSCCDFTLAVALTSVTDQTLAEMKVLVSEHGVNTFKVFMSFSELMINSKEMMRVLKAAKELGCVVQVHAENGDLIAQNRRALLSEGIRGPEGHLLAQQAEVEEEAVRRACCLAREVGVPLTISGPTSAGAVEVIKEFREKGLVAILEASIAGLSVDGGHYYNSCHDHAANFVSSPPLRLEAEAREALLGGLQSDLATVSSAHCARARTEVWADFTEIPQGLTGVEERLGLLYELGVKSGKMEMEKFVAVTSTNAAKILNIFPRKGCIAEGSDADLVILNPAAPRTISQKSQQSNAEFNIFENLHLSAGPEFVLSGGKITVAEFQVNAGPGEAGYVDCLPFPAVCYDQITPDLPAPRHVVRAQVPSDAVDGGPDSNGDGFGLTTPRGFRGQQVLNKNLGVYQRPLSAHGVRNQQDSTFSLTG